MKDLNENIVAVKSMDFAVRCVKLAKFLRENYHEYDLASQILKSGTSIGANVREALRGQSRADFRAKMNISLREANEAQYWIELLRRVGYPPRVSTRASLTIALPCANCLCLSSNLHLKALKMIKTRSQSPMNNCQNNRQLLFG